MSKGAAVCIVCKTPDISRGKSRLRPLLGAETVARLSACFIRDLTEALETVPAALARRFCAIYSPAGSEEALRPLLPPEWTMVCREAPTVGEVMHASIEALLDDGYDAAILVNADSPTLPPAFVAQAITALRDTGDRLVLGPASDGGYYLIGLKRPHARLFEDIAWSTPEVLARTLDRAAEIGLPVTLLPMWYDVDDAAALALLEAEMAGLRPPFATDGIAGWTARHSRALVAERASLALSA